jgi:hypothetical protein
MSNVVSQEKAADMLHVSRTSVQAAKAVLDRGGPELVAAVESGEVGLHKAAETVRNDEPAPLTTAAVADKRRAEVAAQDARYRQKEIRAVFKALNETERSRFLAEVIGIDNVVAQFATMLDSERRQIADAAFNSIKSKTARHGHERVVYAWLEETRGVRSS